MDGGVAGGGSSQVVVEACDMIGLSVCCMATRVLMTVII